MRLSLPLRGQELRAVFYSAAHLDDASAAQLLQLPADVPIPPATPLPCGRRRRFWVGNCVAVGAAAGLPDPLSAMGAQLIHDAVTRLVDLFPDQEPAERLIAEYERRTSVQYERVRDFTALHFALPDREDSGFWRERRHVRLPDSLEYRLKLFRNGGRLAAFDDEVHDESDWISVLSGLGVWPQRADPLTLGMIPEQLAQRIERMRQIMRQAAEAMPAHGAHLRKLGLVAARGR